MPRRNCLPSADSVTTNMRTHLVSGQFARFILVGANNTLVTYCTYLLLVNWLSYPVAWGIGYVLGITAGYLANALFVFRRPLHGRSALAFFCAYLLQYLVSVLLLRVALLSLMMPHWLAAIAVISLTTPPMFLLVRLVMNFQTPHPAAGSVPSSIRQDGARKPHTERR